LNRINTIIICITALAIFFILKQESKPDVDISQYETEINLLQIQLNELQEANDSLATIEKELESKIASYDVTIKNLKGQINVIKRETKAKLDSVDKFGDDELERFFAERYRQLYDSIKKANSETGN
jgi:FtsZ-binding cell division protein ZapB